MCNGRQADNVNNLRAINGRLQSVLAPYHERNTCSKRNTAFGDFVVGESVTRGEDDATNFRKKKKN